jgi:four helix bundle protein
MESVRPLPHHRLVVWGVARELYRLVREASIRDTELRNQALRSAKSCCLNVAEAAGRFSRADKARVFAIARAEAVECVAAVEIAREGGDVSAEAVAGALVLGDRIVAMLTRLIR